MVVRGKRAADAAFRGPSAKRPKADLWEGVFLIGHPLAETGPCRRARAWDFDHLPCLLKSLLRNHSEKDLYLFGVTEPQFVDDDGVKRILAIPAICCALIDRGHEPPEVGAITSVQMASEELVPFKQLKLSWNPVNTDSGRPRLYSLHCSQRLCTLRNRPDLFVRGYEYLLPYLCRPRDLEPTAVTQVLVSFERDDGPPLVFAFDKQAGDRLQSFIPALLQENDLPESLAAPVEKAIRKAFADKRAAQAAELAAKQAFFKDRSEAYKQALDSLECVKVYPQNDIATGFKSPFVNRYYGNARAVY